MNKITFPPNKILIVDDEQSALDIMERSLQTEGITNTLTCKDSRRVMDILLENDIEVILLDLTMPHITGEELLPHIRDNYPQIPIIVVTGASEIATAVNCMKMGVFDYLVKAVEKSKLVACVQKAIEIQDLKRQYTSLRERFLSQKLDHRDIFAPIVSQNEMMRSIFLYLESITSSRQPVLITGETGTGKELIARAIHDLSKREDIYIPVNVAGFDDAMFSDNLFGHKQGAYTGAERARKGLIEEASRGTIFLDEIGDLSLTSQVKLLRLLEKGEYFPLGSEVIKKAEARIIVGTNKDLKALVDRNQFRKDLYFRLHIHNIHLPPLRERMDDLPLLIDHFLAEAADEIGTTKPDLPEELYPLLEKYLFPGNIRELRSIIFDAVARTTSGTLSIEGIKLYIKEHSTQVAREELQQGIKPAVIFTGRLPSLKQNTELLIDEALKRTNGNQSAAARLINVSPQAISKRLKKKTNNPA